MHSFLANQNQVIFVCILLHLLQLSSVNVMGDCYWIKRKRWPCFQMLRLKYFMLHLLHNLMTALDVLLKKAFGFTDAFVHEHGLKLWECFATITQSLDPLSDWCDLL